MTYALRLGENEWIERPDLSGPRLSQTWFPIVRVGSTNWGEVWTEACKPTNLGGNEKSFAFWQTAPTSFACITETLPIESRKHRIDASQHIAAIEALFELSATDLAKVLRVSRPMVYHYRVGMEPTEGNLRRIEALGGLAREYGMSTTRVPKRLLRTPQPEGQSLFDYLCDDQLNLKSIRRILARALEDLPRREQLAHTLAKLQHAQGASPVVRARHSQGKPIYVSDPESPGKVIQIGPDQTRLRGRIVNRKFVPDDE